MSNKFEYDVCFSFAGEDREYVEKVADALKSSDVNVFYDRYEQVNLWGKDLYVHLDEIYRTKARFCVLFASKAYSEKLWTSHERRSAQARAISEKSEYILPARFDETEIPGILDTVAYISLKNITPADFAQMIKNKVDSVGKLSNEVIEMPKNESPASLLEKYIVDEKHKIDLYRLFASQGEIFASALSGDDFLLTAAYSTDLYIDRLKAYESVSIDYIDFIETACHWVANNQIHYIKEFLIRICSVNQKDGAYNEDYEHLRFYPALIMYYVIGISSLRYDKFELLRDIMRIDIMYRKFNMEMPVFKALVPTRIVLPEILRKIPGYERMYVPNSEHLYELLKNPMRKIFINESDYDKFFNRFELFNSICYACEEYFQNSNENKERDYKFPMLSGRFVYNSFYEESVIQKVYREIDKMREKSPAIASGMFFGDADLVLKVLSQFIHTASRRFY